MSAPSFTGPGYFAGESPDGLTTVAGVPVAAQVRIYWRETPGDAGSDVPVANTSSAADGTWQIADLNPDLQYVIRGSKTGFDDVTIVGCIPTRTDIITATGAFTATPEFDGVAGSMLIEGGLPPYTVSVINPLPYGLTPAINYRTLTIDGTSDDAGLWPAVVRVAASNGPTLDVPVPALIGEVLSVGYAIDNDWEITLTWPALSSADAIRVYRDTAPIHPAALPAPLVTLAGSVVRYDDDAIAVGQTYYYAIGVEIDGSLIVSNIVQRTALWSPLDLPNGGIFLDANDLPAGALADWRSANDAGLSFVQPDVAKRPSVVLGELAGKPVVRFNGTSHALHHAGIKRDIFQGIGDAWAFALYKKRTMGESGKGACVIYAAASTAVATTNRFNMLAVRAATPGVGAFAARLGTTDAVAVIGRSTSDVGTWVMRFDEAAYSSASVRIYTNGALDATGSLPTAGVTSATPAAGLMIGSGGVPTWVGNTDFADIDLAAVVIGSGAALSAANRERIFGWAAHRFAMVDKLPAAHPYKSVAP